MDADTLISVCGTLAATFLGAVGGYVSAAKFTGVPKLAETALKFSEMFHGLRQQQLTLNSEYATLVAENRLGCDYNDVIGLEWWHRFFDLMLMQVIFFKDRLLSENLLAQWMTWRFFEYRETPKTFFMTYGKSYREGWEYWKQLPGNEHSLLTGFLDSIHAAADGQEVYRAVKSWRF